MPTKRTLLRSGLQDSDGRLEGARINDAKLSREWKQLYLSKTFGIAPHKRLAPVVRCLATLDAPRAAGTDFSNCALPVFDSNPQRSSIKSQAPQSHMQRSEGCGQLHPVRFGVIEEEMWIAPSIPGQDFASTPKQLSPLVTNQLKSVLPHFCRFLAEDPSLSSASKACKLFMDVSESFDQKVDATGSPKQTLRSEPGPTPSSPLSFQYWSATSTKTDNPLSAPTPSTEVWESLSTTFTLLAGAEVLYAEYLEPATALSVLFQHTHMQLAKIIPGDSSLAASIDLLTVVIQTRCQLLDLRRNLLSAAPVSFSKLRAATRAAKDKADPNNACLPLLDALCEELDVWYFLTESCSALSKCR